MATTLALVSPASWRRTKIWQVTSDSVTSVSTAHGLSDVASPSLNTDTLANANIIVSVRTQGASTVIPPTVIFEAGGTTFLANGPVGATSFITMKRPHTSTR